jgi:hypothetical protein
MAKKIKRGKGLFSSIYKKDGLYKKLYSSVPKIQLESSDMRLGDYDFGQTAPDASAPGEPVGVPLGSPTGPPPAAPAGPPTGPPPAAPAGKKSFFSQDIMGIPVWLLCILALGFAFKYKQRKKEDDKTLPA